MSIPVKFVYCLVVFLEWIAYCDVSYHLTAKLTVIWSQLAANVTQWNLKSTAGRLKCKICFSSHLINLSISFDFPYSCGISANHSATHLHPSSSFYAAWLSVLSYVTDACFVLYPGCLCCFLHRAKLLNKNCRRKYRSTFDSSWLKHLS